MATTRLTKLQTRLSILIAAFIAAPAIAQVSLPSNGSSPDHAPKLELVVQTGHTHKISAIAFSPDGKLLVTSGSGSDRTLKLWEVATGLELRSFYAEATLHMDLESLAYQLASPAAAVAFSPDGQEVASTDGVEVRLWDVITGQKIRVFDRLDSIVLTLAFSPDGRWLALGRRDGTIELWDTLQDYKPKTLASHSGAIAALTISADSRWLASASEDMTAKIWDLSTGELSRTLSGHTRNLTGISMSPDAEMVATSSLDRTLRIWRRDTGTEIKEWTISEDDGNRGFYSVAFSPDGRTLVAGDLYYGYIGDAKTLQLLAKFRTTPSTITTLAFSPDSSAFASSDESGFSPRIYDANSGRVLQSFSPDHYGVADQPFRMALTPDDQALLLGFVDGGYRWDLSTRDNPKPLPGVSVAFNSDGNIMAFAKYTSSLTSEIALWDGRKIKQIRSIANLSTVVTDLDLSPDGQLLAYHGLDGTIKLLDANSGVELRTLDKRNLEELLKFSPDGRWIVTCANSEQGYVVRVSSVKDGHELTSAKFGLCSGDDDAAFSPDSRWLAFASREAVKLWQFSGSGEVRSLNGNFADITMFCSVTFGPGGKTLAASRSDHTISLFDVDSGRLIRTLSSPTGTPRKPVFSRDGRLLLASYDDKRIRIWDAQTGEQLATVTTMNGGDWAIVDSKGRFDASPAGMELLHWAVGNETIELSQLKKRYYEPGLLAKIMGFNPEPLRDVTAFDNVALSPGVKTVGDVDPSGKLRVDLTNRGGGLGRTQVLVNDKEFLAEARDSNFNRQAARATLSVDLSSAPVALGEENTVRVIAWNQEGYLSSRPIQTVWKPAGAAAKKSPELYAIISGISNYSSPELQLKFAAKDADNMARALSLAGSRLFGREHVHLTVFSTSDNAPDLQPSKANLQHAFEEAQKSKPRDVLLVYLAGHGVARNDTYAYPTKEARTLDLSDPAILAQSAVTSEELVEWIKKVPARHQVMILDTCAAGLAAAKLVEKRGVPGEQIRALDRLKDRTGFQVLMGSAANSSSYEASQFGEGLLTYSLLQGMKGAALRDDEFVDVNKLFQYAADRVPELAQDIGGIQRPQILAPQGVSFDVGQLLKEDKEQIPLAVVKPMILRPVLLNLDAAEDNLDLMPALRKRLREESYAQTRGAAPEPTAIFVDEEEMPGAIRPTGTYTILDKRVVVNLVLSRNDKKTKIQVEGATDDKVALVSKILAALLEASKIL